MRPSEYRLLEKLFDHYMNKALDKREKKCYDLPRNKEQLFERRKKKK